MQVSVTVTGLDHVQQCLSKLGEELHDFTTALEGLGRSLLLFYGDTVFNSFGSALGKKWEALAPSTVAEKSKRYPGRGPLQRTGAMQKGFYATVTPNTLEIGNKVPYFIFHQLGTGFHDTVVPPGLKFTRFALHNARFPSATPGSADGRGRHLPARPMLGVNPRVETIIKLAIETEVRRKIALTEA